MEGAVEEPHGIFSNELVLDLILSSLDEKSQLTARLVCKKWNDRILAQFPRKLALRFKREEEPAAVRKRLRDFDPRLLSSLKFYEYYGVQGLKLSRVFRGVAESWVAEKICRLSLVRLDKKAVDCLIKVGNKGQLCNLQELRIVVTYSLEQDGLSVKSLRPNAFPKLKHLTLTPRPDHSSYYVEMMMLLFETAGHLKTFQSFVISAPNLQAIETSLPLDLSGLQDLKTLRVDSTCGLFTMEEGIRMMESAGSRLTSLKLKLDTSICSLSLSGLPLLPKLTCLEVRCNTEEQLTPFDWARVPNLRKLTLEVRCKLWSAFLPVPDHLKEMCFKIHRGCDCGHCDTGNLGEAFVAVVKSKVPHLVFELNRWSDGLHVSELFNDFLGAEANIELREPEEGTGRRVLEFHQQEYLFRMGKPIKNFASVMEKLKRNWDVVRFKNWKMMQEDAAVWAEVSLSGEKKDFECPAFLRERASSASD